MLNAYLAGEPWPEVERLALLRLIAWHDDLFTATYEDLRAVIGEEDEHERDKPG